MWNTIRAAQIRLSTFSSIQINFLTYWLKDQIISNQTEPWISKFKFFQFNLTILFEFSIFSIQFDCLVWIFNFFQFNLNVLFEFSIFINSIWIFCLNCQFLSILTLSRPNFFSNGFFFKLMFQLNSNKTELDWIEVNLVHFKLFEQP